MMRFSLFVHPTLGTELVFGIDAPPVLATYFRLKPMSNKGDE